MKFSEKALVFGLDSFTGSYMKSSLEKQNINVVGTSFDEKSSNYCNITDYTYLDIVVVFYYHRFVLDDCCVFQH